MNSDFIFALYVFCQDYHSGQWSRGYRILSRLVSRYRPSLSDSAYQDIRTGGEEWLMAHIYYKELEAKYSNNL